MGNSNGKPVVFTDEGKHTNTLTWWGVLPNLHVERSSPCGDNRPLSITCR